MRRVYADESDEFELGVDETCELESLRLPVVPPYVLVIPFIEEPDVIDITGRDSLGEDGVHGAIYTLKAVRTGQATIRLGFTDLRSGETVVDKTIGVRVV